MKLKKYNQFPNLISQYLYKDLVILTLIGIAFLIFTRPSSLYFLNDDFDSLPYYANAKLLSHGGMRLTEKASTMLNIWLFKTKPLGYILTNLFIHITVCFIGCSWLKEISNSLDIELKKNIRIGIILLFMWYAFHTEAIVWTVCRTASLSLLFFLLGWLCILWGAKRNILLWLSLPCFILGVFAYENCWLYPFSLSFWWCLLDKKSIYKTKKTMGAILCSWILLAAYFPVRKFIATQWIGDYLSDNVVKFDLRMYFKNTFALFARGFLPPMDNKIILVLATLAIGIALVIVVFFLWKQKTITKLWWLLSFNWILSYVFFVSLGIDTNGYESERYIYFSSMFLCAWLIYSFSLLPIKKPIPQILFSLLLLYHIVFLNKAVQAFRNAGQLAKATIVSVQKNISAKNIYVEQLPTKNFGVPMFRFGFNKTIKWLDPTADTSKIIIVSKTIFKWKEQVEFTDSLNNNSGNCVIRFYAAGNKNAITP